MRAEVLGVGTELLLGQIPNTNAQWISQALADIGVDVLQHQVVGDNLERIAAAFRLALSRADVVISTGGLGPTGDDITREGLAAALGIRLIRDPSIERLLRERYAVRGREMPESNLRQCDVPEGARAILPQRGTAPGIAIEAPGGARVYLLAGVPAEMREMMEGTILPELTRLAGPAAIVSHAVKTVGIAEARVGELLADLFEGSVNPTIAYLAGGIQVRVRVTAKAPTRAEAEALIAPVVDEVRARLGDHVFGEGDDELEDVVGRMLRAAGRTLACAESLTGGSLAARLTAVPGASDYFLGSAVCYTGEAKHEILGVSRATLDGPGVVSEECALEMARGARRLYGADVAVALTGAAGPDPHGGRGPGTVCVALVAADGEVGRTVSALGDRAMVRRWAEQAALDLLRRHLAGLPVPERLGPATTGTA